MQVNLEAEHPLNEVKSATGKRWEQWFSILDDVAASRRAGERSAISCTKNASSIHGGAQRLTSSTRLRAAPSKKTADRRVT
jgi:hypothetical protein